MHSTPFELLELPDGRWYVVKPVSSTLIAGSFARLEASQSETGDSNGPVGVYASRGEAELAIDRAGNTHAHAPLAPFAAWIRQD